MDQTKIKLSQKELELVTNADWILTKNGIMSKVKYLLEQLQEQQSAFLHTYRDQLPAEIFSISPKISKGENYQGLPYLVLDQPRIFEKENVFAIRTLFWWGKFFSVTLHLSGKYKKQFENQLSTAYRELAGLGSFYCINTDPWEHHFEESNFKELRSLDEQEFSRDVINRRFIKISSNWKLENWEDIDTRLYKHYQKLIEILVN